MDINIEPARHTDMDAMTRLLQQLFTIEADFSFDPAKTRLGLERLLDDSRACLLVARADNEVIGMCSAQLVISTAEGAYSAWIEDVVVDIAHRSKGVGVQLLEHISAWAKEQGATRLQLLADMENHPALGFYRRCGWQQTQLLALRRPPA